MIFAISASPIFRVICNLHVLKNYVLAIPMFGTSTLLLCNFSRTFRGFPRNTRGIGVNSPSTVSGIYAALGVTVIACVPAVTSIPEPVLLNVSWAPALMPRNEFRQPM